MCGVAAGWGGRPAGNAKGGGGGGGGRLAATGNSCAAKTDFYFAVGRVAARAAARSNGSKLRGACAAAGGLSPRGRRSLDLDRLSCRENHLVAPVVVVCLARVVPPTPRRIILRLRYTDKLRDEYSWD